LKFTDIIDIALHVSHIAAIKFSNKKISSECTENFYEICEKEEETSSSSLFNIGLSRRNFSLKKKHLILRVIFVIRN
jgi:hypothetical protein